ncbi:MULTISPECIES: NCS2 family permease [Snodgrassella]|uniref:NCS2 family permease n=1 Tax=Snodgrassella TaxID=1193515 RepID=UPI0004D8BE56|nr:MULTISPECIES: NCS2 family permease [Snodgrassella]KES10869.1 Permease [Snodgrassella alvi SCGC AB-598-O11]MBI0068233.1 NCS2 family permease [Snodgrassella sp. M0110]MBI0077125.1 NCS2 family permease [Snodgrassella sp. M0118]MBI0079534.1 NCS2 family permease [Snodgrassella sp. M0112]MBI0130325.1 NCS2 family permease [Snodgrassella sp. W8124]
MSPAGTSFLDRFFKIKESGSSVRTEVLAGLTTFLAMSYILVVNPSILKDAGMDFGAVFVATCISSAFACMMMGLVANYPIALAPGMGLNAYFTYAVVKGMGISWQVALGAVFVSGIVFIILSLFKVREAIVNSLPNSLKYSIGGGIGLFLALVALKSAKVVVSNPDTLVSLGDIHSPQVLLTIVGFCFIVTLEHFRIRGGIIIGILVITAIASVAGLNEFKGVFAPVPSLAPTFLQLDFHDLFNMSLVSVIFVFFFVDLFDSTGVLIGVAGRAGLLVDGKLPRVKKALLADSTAIVVGAGLGTSSTTAYVESAAGAAAGGRTGLTAVVVGLLMLASLWFSKLAASVPAYATAPALLYVGVLMMRSMTEIDWKDVSEAAPAFFTLIFMPFAYSIADGIAMGFISYALIKLFCGRVKEVSYMVWIIAVLWAFKLLWLGA